jgi:GTPase
MSYIVAIVGRPNVGKSTLFNRLTESNLAIVDEQSGVTRDRLYGKVLWNGHEFSVIDTGGYIDRSGDIFEEEIKKQVVLAIDEADSILFMVDVTDGVTDMDARVADLLRRSGKQVLLVANKVDNTARHQEIYDFYNLGLGDIYPISSMNGSGTGELLDKLVAGFELLPPDETTADLPKLAIIGRPNVGKSSLINAFIGEERNIVTPIAGTTRDSIYTLYKKFNYEFYLIDTAGLRKKNKEMQNLEFYSVMRSIRAIEHSDVCLVMIDAVTGMETQDLNIFNLAKRNKKGIVILMNKWDLVEKDNKTTESYRKDVMARIAPFTDVPLIFTSTISKQRIHKALEAAMQVYENRKKRISTSKLNEALLPVIEEHHPPTMKGKMVKIKYITQLPTPTPTFAFFCNLPQYIKDPYKRYLENQIREKFDFSGVPITLVFRQK